MARRNNIEDRLWRNVDISHVTDWSGRALPRRLAKIAHPDLADFEGYDNFLARISRENQTYLRQKYIRNGGVIIGYHGTTSSNAEKIIDRGFKRTRNEEGKRGVSAWDAVVAPEAARFAEMRSADVGENDGGKIIRVQMTEPHEDEWFGRLEWLADHKKTEVLQVYSPEEFQRLHELGHLALMDERPDAPNGQ
jgi:hypothetical protein